MEIIKQNETFNLEDTTDKFEMQGNVSVEVSGSLSIHFNVKNLSGERIGDCYYHNHDRSKGINLGISCSEEHREDLSAYVDYVIDSILTHFEYK